MEYFKILNLNQEPFSNSPEPDFFFPVGQYQACLQKLELAIRLCRGLNVVIGEVGTGKTTLCRQLLVRFANPEEAEERPVDAHLIMDPSFGTPIEFLSVVAGLLGVEVGDQGRTGEGPSEWHLKEMIKNHLFRKGVDEKRIVVLIIDEGQKLPEFCVELLREFLNYETNEHKLLQIVIFAQKEFEGFLRDHRNVEDRVNQYLFLKPLDFTDTVKLIRFRLARAAGTGRPPALFTYPAMWAVYRVTEGYPRRINTLCHQVMLALIIQNRTKAGWAIVNACAGRVMLRSRRFARWAVPAGAVVALLVLAFAFGPGYLGFAQRDSISKSRPMAETPSPSTAAPAGKAETPVPRSAQAVVPVQEPPVKALPVIEPPAKVSPPSGEARNESPAKEGTAVPRQLGQITVTKGSSLWLIFSDIYGTFDAKRFAMLAKANPHIRNLDLVKVGEKIHLPALKVEGNPLSRKPYWVEVMHSRKLADAYEALKSLSDDSSPLWLVPHWNGKEGITFSLLMREGFSDEKAAAAKAGRLPARYASDSRIVGAWPGDTVFFSRQ